MKLKVEYPNLRAHKWINNYIKFPLNNFLLSGAKVSYAEDLIFPGKGMYFTIRINGKLIFIDLQDGPREHYGTLYTSSERGYHPENMDMPIFKSGMRPDIKYEKNVFPYGPFHVWNNETPKDLEKLLSYKNEYNPWVNNNIINTTSMLYPHTRKLAYSKLDYTKIYKDVNFIRNRLSQYQHWDRLSNCLGVLNISGSSANVVDKAPIEAMWRGVCVIHNDIDIMLPHNRQLTKNEHYICLADDYSDINEKINYLYDNRNLAKEMGANARELMLTTSTPKKRLEWILQVVEEYYKG